MEDGVLLEPSGETLSRGEFLGTARGAEYILIGETHDNACDHRVQARLIRWMAKNGTQPAVGLEMVPADAQSALDRLNTGNLTLEELPEALNWEETWGHPFSGYKPVFQAARQEGLPLYGLNISPEDLDAIRDKGRQALRQGERPRRYIPPSEEEKNVLDRAYERHEQLPSLKNQTERLDRERFFLIQAVWDSSMAAAAVRVHSQTGRRMIILAGQGHIEHGRGIPRRLRILDASAHILTVSAWRGLEQPDPEQSDLLFSCPITFESRLGFTLKFTSRGGLITKVEPESRAQKAGMRAGDILLAAGGEPFRELMDLHRAAVRAYRDNAPLMLRIERNGTPKELSLSISR
ncbi:MAG: ChaN family lipoprotein [Desulfohalobiaceae bacterium]